MIRVLSREPDRSMLGLSHCKSNESWWFTFFGLIVLLDGGGQAGDPAVLQETSCQPDYFHVQKPSVSTLMVVAAELVVCSFRGVANIVGWVRGQTYVALEGALENKLLSHIEFFVEMGSTKRRSGGLGG